MRAASIRIRAAPGQAGPGADGGGRYAALENVSGFKAEINRYITALK